MDAPNNPLLDFAGLPRFSDFKPEHVAPAVERLLQEGRALVDALAADPAPPTWDSFVIPLDDAGERLGRAWGLVTHLNAVVNTPALREAYSANLPKVTQFWSELAQHEGLYRRFKALAASPEYAALPPARRKVLDNELRDFRLGGAELPEAQKGRFMEIQERLAQIASRFEDNVLDATNDFELLVDRREDLAGLPDDALEAARETAQREGKSGWKFTLHAPSWMPVMQYCDNRALRSTMYRAYVTRASELGKPQWDNGPLIAETLRLRREKARLLGFGSYAEYSLATKMADTPEQVLGFLRELAARAKPFAERDMRELADFARSELGLEKLEAWDIAYASEKLRLARYAFSEHEVKQYLPETTVIPGLFRLVENLYGVRIVPEMADTWHDDVSFFTITDRHDRIIGHFYMDLYARPHKRGGAWMDDAVTRRRTRGGIQPPAAYLTCNFSPPVGGKPALFTHDEVLTLFHEFGHGLHHLLTEVEELGVSGINGVEWDAVELPSQFMENFCWEWQVLAPMTRHVDSGATLPRALFDKMIAAKNFQSGMQTVRQIEFALFDMHLHHDYDPDGDKGVLQLLDEIRREVAVVFPPEFNRFPMSFTHIFAGGYAAGYYSYKWAEVLSADAYSLFEENGVVNPEVGARFRSEVLAVGGSRPALESFVAFRGREPQIDALLRHSGLVEEAAAA